jgi:hypothetical protein
MQMLSYLYFKSTTLLKTSLNATLPALAASFKKQQVPAVTVLSYF